MWNTDLTQIPKDIDLSDVFYYRTIPVLLTVEYNHFTGLYYLTEHGYYSHSIDFDGEIYAERFYEVGRDGYKISGKVIAWQLLPEPYKPLDK